MIKNLQSILTQNHLGTSDPIYVVYSKQEICIDSNFDYDKAVYLKSGDDDYTELSPQEFEDLESAYYLATAYRTTSIDASGEEIDNPMPKCPVSDDDFDPDDWEIRHIKLIDRFEQAFFIRENAEDFIASQKHNLSSPYIYVESAYRNPEWRAIRDLLIKSAKENENKLKFGLEYNDIVDGMWVVYSELPHSNYANSLNRIWKTAKGWKEHTLVVHWENEYQNYSDWRDCDLLYIWDSKNYAPVDYDEKTSPVEFMNKILPLTVKGEQDA